MVRITFTVDTNNEVRLSFYIGFAMMTALLQFELASVIDRHEQSARQLRMANGSNLISDFHCNIPYDDFRCTPIRTKDCLHSHQFKVARILPLILFATEIFILREVFSISGSYKSFFVYVFWTVALYALVSISIVVIKKSCYYEAVGTYLGFIAFAFVIVFARIAMSHDIDPPFLRDE